MNPRRLFETRRGRLLGLVAALLLAALDGLLCARAAAGRSGSWSFPIDDAYIYANYVRALQAGQPFQYNPGETSGGVTGPAWMFLLAAVQPLTALLGSMPATLAPRSVQAADPALALTAGRIYAGAYLLGTLGLAAAAAAVAWLAWECLRRLPGRAPALAAILAAAALLTDHHIIWAAYSGLELPLALALVPLIPATILHRMRSAECGVRSGDGADSRSPSPTQHAARSTQHSSPFRIPHSAFRIPFYALPALLAWVRPELAIIGAVGAVGLVGGALRGCVARRTVAAYSAALHLGLGSLSALFLAATSRPLPSSFYAKVAPFVLADLPAALREWIAARAWQPFALLAAAALGLGLLWWADRRSPVASRQSSVGGEGSGVRGQGSGISNNSALNTQHSTLNTPARGSGVRGQGSVAGREPPVARNNSTLNTQHSTLNTPALLPAIMAAAYLAAMLVALRWFGQQDRYILPSHTLLLPLAVAPLAVFATRPRSAAVLARVFAGRRSAGLGLVLAALALITHVVTVRQWAATDYALFVQNIEDAHVVPARWIADHTPPGAVVAAEPIGAVRLFSGRPTIDLVGLTTPAQLGHYGDWPATQRLLQARHAAFLLYYPAWWPAHRPLSWAHEQARFAIPDNRIAGAGIIAVYALDQSP